MFKININRMRTSGLQVNNVHQVQNRVLKLSSHSNSPSSRSMLDFDFFFFEISTC